MRKLSGRLLNLSQDYLRFGRFSASSVQICGFLGNNIISTVTIKRMILGEREVKSNGISMTTKSNEDLVLSSIFIRERSEP